MMRIRPSKSTGFTLIEMLLVLIIASMIIYMIVLYLQQRTLTSRMDKTSAQMQQILNASLSYYVVKQKWPTSVACLQLSGGADCNIRFLPNNLTSPWGQNYTITAPGGTTRLLYVYTSITSTTPGAATSIANVIAGTLPLSYTSGVVPNPPNNTAACGSSSTTCYVVGSVNIPGQNLNNATAVNFAGLYKHGGCVPVPDCPVDTNGNTMTPQIMVVPVSVSGVNDPGSSNPVVYPLTSFTAYATDHNGTLDNRPLSCYIPAQSQVPTQCTIGSGTATPSNRYWRVCLQVVTEKSDVSLSNTTTGSGAWGQYVTLMAITRCTVSGEPSGSGFNVFSR